MKKTLFSLLIFCSLFFLKAQCDTTNITGDLIISSSQNLSGLYLISGLFKVDSGVTVSVTPYTTDSCGSLTIESNEIEILGVIDGNAAGFTGGNGGTIQSGGVNTIYLSSCADKDDCYTVQVNGGNAGSSGIGQGNGFSGTDGTSGIGPKQKCSSTDDDHGLVGGAGGAGGGAGGSYGGYGADGENGGDGSLGGGACGSVASCATPDNGTGGTGGIKGSTYGSIGGSDIFLGSGGAGAGSGGKSYSDGAIGGNGGNGGALVKLTASNNISISGDILVNGEDGGAGGDGGNGGKTGKCCSDGCNDCAEITYSCGSGAGGGAGGGSGGGISVSSGVGTILITGNLEAKGGHGGSGGSGGSGSGSCDHSPILGICECDGASTPSGDPGVSGGGGGGGRIKIFTSRCEDIFPLNMNINGGNGSNNGGLGTFYISGLSPLGLSAGNIYCESDTIDAGPGFDTYWWSNGDTTQSIIANNNGYTQNYTVIVKKGTLCYTDTFMILNAPQVSLNPGGSVTLNCGDTLLVDAGSYSTYSWNTGENTQSIVVDSTASYYVYVTDSNGCYAYSDTLSVNVLNSYNDTISASICYGDTFLLGSQSLFDSGTYSEAFTSILNCDSFVTVHLSIIQSSINANLTGPDSVFVNDTALYIVSDGDSLFWSINGGQVLSGPATDTLTILWDSLAGTGNVSVEVYDSFGCFIDTLEMTVYIQDISTSVYENENIKLRIYPNPAKSSITIEFDKDGTYDMNIYDVLGNLVKRIENIRTNKIVIEKEALGSGSYFIELRSDKEIIKRKILIE